MPGRYSATMALAAVFVLAIAAHSPARAQSTPDVMGLSAVSAGHAKVRLTVTAGPSGAPDGFEVCWMPATLFASYGGIWPPPWAAGEGWVDFLGVGTTNTWGSANVDFKLAPNQSLDVEIGDTYDESGVSGTWRGELTDGTDYVFCAYAVIGSPGLGGPLSATLHQSTTPQGQHCTYTLGYWKNHTSSWPVTSLTLGTVSYNATQLLQILNQSPAGNGLVVLAHQLITTRLNIANGANGSSVAGTIAAADALIGALVVPPVGAGYLASSSCSGYTQSLDDFNNNEDDEEQCHSTPAHEATWGGLKASYR